MMATKAPAEKGTDEKPKRKVGPRTTKYMSVKVSPDEIPSEEESSGRGLKYHDILASGAANDPGEWYLIAEFTNPTGAQMARNQLQGVKNRKTGEVKQRKLPPGDWEFRAAKIPNPTDPNGKRHSRLYARLNG